MEIKSQDSHIPSVPVLDYLAKDDIPSLGALGPVSMLKTFANSVGRKFIKGHAKSQDTHVSHCQE